MAIDKIETPRGVIVKTKDKAGVVTATLSWNPGFGTEWTAGFNRIQKFIDSEVLRLSQPYVPLVSGMLMHSGELGTVIGSGEVIWNAPYAASQYHNTAKTRPYDSQRGSHWFDRMKADRGKEIINSAKKMAGGL